MRAFGVAILMIGISIVVISGAIMGACLGAIILPMKLFSGSVDVENIKTTLSTIDPADRDQI